MSDPAPPDEFELIGRYFAPLAAGFPGAFNLLDDAAVLAPSAGHELVVTTDALIEGVHFLPDDPPDLIARKALRVNLSDLAAKGARPRAYLLDLCLPSTATGAWVGSFARGLAKDQTAFGIHLIGGDTCKTPGPLTLAITAMGEVMEGAMIRRGGARVGDDLWVTGTIGDAVLGLAVRRNALPGAGPKDRKFLVERYRCPEPRVAIGHRLVGVASAGMDVSDGLIQDLGHICSVSRVGALVEAVRVPLSGPVRRAVERDPGRFLDVVGGGDDYEILFTAPPQLGATVLDFAAAAGVQATRIGRIVVGTGITVVDAAGQPMKIERAGYRHF